MARQIDALYVKTGQVRVVFRSFPVLGQESLWAAEASLCAGDQDSFWGYHEKLFAATAGGIRVSFDRPTLKRFASELGLKADLFDPCFDGGNHSQQLRDLMAEGQRRGVTGTPTFFVNNVKIVGAAPFEKFREAIEAELR